MKIVTNWKVQIYWRIGFMITLMDSSFRSFYLIAIAMLAQYPFLVFLPHMYEIYD